MPEDREKFDPEVATDVELINAIAQKSEAAFDELHKRFSALVRRVIGGVLKNGCPNDHHQDAEEDTWFRLFKYARPFDEERGGTVDAYIATVARNLALTHRKRCREKGKREKAADDQELALLESAQTAKEWAVTYAHENTFAASDIIDRALSELNNTHQTVVTLSLSENLPYRIISERTQLTVANIKVIIYRFKQRCKEIAED